MIEKPILYLAFLLLGMGMFNWKDTKMLMRMFNDWAVRTQYWGPLVFGGACGLLVMVITWPWSY